MRNEPLIFFHLKLVAKISLGVGTVAVLSLLISLLLISGPIEETYSAIVRTNSMTQANLGKVMLAIGLMLVAIAGVITWLITLYSSFRIVGPLYRFTQNLKLAGTSDSSPLIELRKGDALGEQSANIKQAVVTLRDHYAVVEQVSAEALQAFENNDAEAYKDAVTRLKALDEKVRL
ncbi:hypothetical protein [Noviherbaspirillum denitrificans]|uniref:HAMP domain-containing protein n=1 Tax=Noviherbaspirillum denitrificans TaxID=1968433 RepID=A0A254TMD0_9BURK|nr:hypothetical protein [Noviherbaspirillum denitrificans]OWW21773.1 hypothetical protein AYR66_22035 [Noviherbaspirillum denitrificans]